MQYVNEFEIIGKIVSIKSGRFPAIRLVTKSGKLDSYPLVQCSQKMIDDLKLGVQDHVQVKGRVQTIFVKTPDKGYQRRQVFKAKEIAFASTLCEEKFGSSGKFFDSPTTRVYIKGVFIMQKLRDDGWASMVIQTSDNERNTIKVNIKSNPKSKTLKEGDIVCVVGGISTVNKEFGKDKRHFENIIVNDLSVEKPEKEKKEKK